jgi:hypothetical protein
VLANTKKTKNLTGTNVLNVPIAKRGVFPVFMVSKPAKGTIPQSLVPPGNGCGNYSLE